MKRRKLKQKTKDKNNKTTEYAIIDIVSDTRNIADYSTSRPDYKRLAEIALENNINSIRYISPASKDYPSLCEIALNGDVETFKFIDKNVSNYKELGTKAILEAPHLVVGIDKYSRYYYYFWKLATSSCYKVLGEINEKRSDLFPLIATALDKEPNAICYVDSEITAYNNLCRFAYSKNHESANYMNINRVDENLAFKIIKEVPDKIDHLDPNVSYYKKACKTAVSIDGNSFRHVRFATFENDLESLFELVEIAKKTTPEIMESSKVLYTLCLKNRYEREKLLKEKINSDTNKLIEKLDEEYNQLSINYILQFNKELEEAKLNGKKWTPRTCPIMVKTR